MRNKHNLKLDSTRSIGMFVKRSKFIIKIPRYLLVNYMYMYQIHDSVVKLTHLSMVFLDKERIQIVIDH